MMKKRSMKTMACLLLVGMMTAGAGCGGGETSSAVQPVTKEEWQAVIDGYDSGKQIMIAGWDNPKHSYEAYKTAADMGLTHLFIWQDRGNFAPGDKVGEGSEDMEEMQTWFTELGLKAIWQTGSAMNSTEAGKFNEKLRNYSCVEGVDIFDEPRMNAMENLRTAMKEFDAEYGSELLCFTNILPLSSSPTDLQGTYPDYLEKYKAAVSEIEKGRRIVSVDVYPLLDRDGPVLDATWLSNMYQLRTLANELDSEFNMFIQSVGYTGHRKPEEEKEIRYQVWTDLCFGITSYTYFTYANDPNPNDGWQYTETICNSDGVPNNEKFYNGCKRVNEEISKLASTYRSFDWEGVLVSYGTQSDMLVDAGLFNLSVYAMQEADFIESYQSQYGAVLGVYGEAQGGNALVVTNYTDPAENKGNQIDIRFKDTDTVLMYRQGEWEYSRAVNGEFEVVLESGEGVFLIPCKLR